MEQSELNAIADVSVIVIGDGPSLSPYVARCLDLFRRAGLHTNIHALGTNIEGPLHAVLAAIESCHSTLHGSGVTRIVTGITLTTRTDRPQSIEEKIASVTSKVGP